MKKVFIHLPLNGLKKKKRSSETLKQTAPAVNTGPKKCPMVDGLVLATIADGFGEFVVDRCCPFYTRLFTFHPIIYNLHNIL